MRLKLAFAFLLLGVGTVAPNVDTAPSAAWPRDAFVPVTVARIAALPAAEQPAWRAYLEASAKRAGLLARRSDRDDSPAGPIAGPPKGGRHTKGLRRDAPDAWYASDEARAIADRVVEWQTAAGAWTKGIDYTRPRSRGAEAGEEDNWSRGTLDNDATSAELRFLARVVGSNDGRRARAWSEALLRGVEYLLAAQYPNGGFPQIYPLAGGYHDAITHNDSAMLHALEILRASAAGESGFAAVPAASRAAAARGLTRGIACLLATQIEAPGGRRTAWCQQHDALTLRPCAARNFEPIAASALESAALVEFLMTLQGPSPAVARAIEDAVAWFSLVALRDVVWQRNATSGAGLSVVPGAPLLWARLYEIGSDRPVFGDRDRSIHYDVTELSAERRLGYGWYGAWPRGVLDAHEKWRRRAAR